MSYAQCLQLAGGRFDVLFGRDEILLCALALGAKGAVGSTYNFLAPVFHRVLTAFQRGDLETARREQLAAIQVIAVMVRHGGLPAGKVMMKQAGIDCGPVRPPLVKLSAEKEQVLRQDLTAAGFGALRIKPG